MTVRSTAIDNERNRAAAVGTLMFGAARQLVFSETGRGVHTVLVDGQTVLSEGRLTTVDESTFRRELGEVMNAVDRDYEQLVAKQKPAIPYLLQANKNLKKAKLGLSRLVCEGLE